MQQVKRVEAERCRQLTVIIMAFTLLIVLCTVMDIDRGLSARFYHADAPRGWLLKDAPPWRWLYDYGEYPGILMAVGALLVLLASMRQRAWSGYRRHCLVLILAVALGPGLVVNGLMKPLWGRPRPRQIVQFGGTQTYLPWWRPGGPGAGKSFPSGHTAMGYILVAGATLVSRRRRAWPQRLAMAAALGYGTLMGVTRIVQGGHFLSDVAWAGGVMSILIMLLHHALIVSPTLPLLPRFRPANPLE